jgi:hypothetical protein
MADEELKTIIKRMTFVKNQIGRILPSIREDISSIVDNHVQDQARIEKILDNLLGYMSLGCGEDEFMALNRYYATVSKGNSELYEKYRREMSEIQ